MIIQTLLCCISIRKRCIEFKRAVNNQKISLQFNLLDLAYVTLKLLGVFFFLLWHPTYSLMIIQTLLCCISIRKRCIEFKRAVNNQKISLQITYLTWHTVHWNCLFFPLSSLLRPQFCECRLKLLNLSVSYFWHIEHLNFKEDPEGIEDEEEVVKLLAVKRGGVSFWRGLK